MVASATSGGGFSHVGWWLQPRRVVASATSRSTPATTGGGFSHLVVDSSDLGPGRDVAPVDERAPPSSLDDAGVAVTRATALTPTPAAMRLASPVLTRSPRAPMRIDLPVPGLADDTKKIGEDVSYSSMESGLARGHRGGAASVCGAYLRCSGRGDAHRDQHRQRRRARRDRRRFSATSVAITFPCIGRSSDSRGLQLDRGTMCRYAAAFHDLTHFVFDAMADESRRTAHVIATDATGILVQNRDQCRRGHFFVLLADTDHVFFRYCGFRSTSTIALGTSTW